MYFSKLKFYCNKLIAYFIQVYQQFIYIAFRIAINLYHYDKFETVSDELPIT